MITVQCTASNMDMQQPLLNAIKEKMDQITLQIQSKAMDKCPVNTGELRRQIVAETMVDGTTVTGKVGTNVEYAPYVHEGTGIYARQGNGRKEVPWTYFDEATNSFVSTEGIEPTPFLEEALYEVVKI